jgi:hypothetical protein
MAAYDITGKMVLYEVYAGEDKVRLTSLAPGVYIVHFFTDEKVEKFKVLKW